MPARAVKTRKWFVGWLALASAFWGAGGHALSGDDVVATDRGIVRGSSSAGMRSFLGIPYAAPPVEEWRWRPPQPATPWDGVRDATTFANHCPQPNTPFGAASVTEDCLYLNVYAPEEVDGSWSIPRPVMVWFHGGALALGLSNDYGPARLVERGVVVVTVNYRLGYLGFLAHPALSTESSYRGSGNYGIMDQQAALRWVRRNITRFGGNPRNVTIFGESAGGLSVLTHLASPASKRLFHRAIVQSGAYALDQPPLALAEGFGAGFAAAVGCVDQSATCLRSVTVEEILTQQPAGGFVPNLDNRVLTLSIRGALASGLFNRVPVMQGSTHDEWRLFVALNELIEGPLQPQDYLDAIAATLGVDAVVAALVASLYPLPAYPGPSEALGAIGTDAVFACNGREAARLLSRYVPVHAFEFDDPDAPFGIVPPVLSFPLGAYHAAEIQYLFDLDGNPSFARFTAEQQALARDMTRYWTQFAWLGQPNFFFTPYWPRYTRTGDHYLSLAPSGPAVIDDFAADHKCAFWVPSL